LTWVEAAWRLDIRGIGHEACKLSAQMAEGGRGMNRLAAATIGSGLLVTALSELRLAFGGVRDEALKNTGQRQEPYVGGGGSVVGVGF
jgi:hypothetical protein